MLKKLILTAALVVSFAYAGPCCKMADTNASKACDTNMTVAKCKLGKDCPCGPECKCGDNCKCKPMKKSKGGMACDVNGTKCKFEDCKCGENCKCGNNCKCDKNKSCDVNKTGKKAKKMKKACEGNCSK